MLNTNDSTKYYSYKQKVEAWLESARSLPSRNLEFLVGGANRIARSPGDLAKPTPEDFAEALVLLGYREVSSESMLAFV